ncbi:MAG TPA: phosphatidylserine decarboxylase family protein [Geobacteraceae bacterium]|jgi:phosphatidylserine decarboxylase|nr:phosphatidylserine decarboxylase family protein [Geobacteraceae bacterium]
MRKRCDAFPVAVEGFPFILAALFITIVLAVFTSKIPALLASCVAVFVVCFFRNPKRIIPDEPDAVVAPADGVIIFVGDARESLLGEEMLKVSIFMSVFNVHINRAPVSGRVADVFYKPGKFLDARDNKATFENEQSGIIVETEKGSKIAFVQVAGLIARRIVSYPKKGDWLNRGERYGLIRFGSRVDVYLPKSVELRMAVGEKTVAGETIIGYLR